MHKPKIKRGNKRKEETVAPSLSQKINELLNDISNNNIIPIDNNISDNDVLNKDEVLNNNNVFNNDDVFNDDDCFNDDDILNDNNIINNNDKPATQDFTTTFLRQIPTLETEHNNQDLTTLNSSNNNQIQNIISSTRFVSSKPITISDSRIKAYVTFRAKNNARNNLMNEICNTMNNLINQIKKLFLRPLMKYQSISFAYSLSDFLEKLKCLFLYAQNPQRSVFEKLVQKIFKCELNSAEGIEWLQTANRYFGDFQNKLVNNVEDLINEFKEERSTEGTLQKEEIITFVD
ncbi:13857_t:CDS:2, partial [Gigaspora margarita]